MAIELSAWKGKRLHFIGIGGAGMSGLARLAHLVQKLTPYIWHLK